MRCGVASRWCWEKSDCEHGTDSAPDSSYFRSKISHFFLLQTPFHSLSTFGTTAPFLQSTRLPLDGRLEGQREHLGVLPQVEGLDLAAGELDAVDARLLAWFVSGWMGVLRVRVWCVCEDDDEIFK